MAPLARRPGQTIVCAVFTAVLTGILANAMFFQTARHPAPIFGGPVVARPLAVAPVPAQPQAAATSAVPVPVPRPVEFTPVGAPIHDSSEPAKDQIGNLLKASSASSPDATRLLAAQRALARLGYAVKPDGVMGGSTRQAIEKFEQARKLPVTGELSARTLRELSSQAGVVVP
ncbi:MAG: Peptidoglycan-binding domain 1 protein [Hyphomicrobiales bacterium]|nr:Peptidoglycan-binding domain 1 protein [Hyphomicrobiales bacterium]